MGAVLSPFGTTATPGGAASGDLGGTYPGPTVTATHLAAALPVAQGGTGSAVQTFVNLAGDLGGTVTVPTVTATHLAAALPLAQGGTGSTTQNFVDLTTNQGSVAGNKVFTGQGIHNSNSNPSLLVNLQSAGQQGVGVVATAADTTARILQGSASGDTIQRYVVNSDGTTSWGPGGAGARDTTLARTAIGILGVTAGSLAITTAGQGIQIKTGSNAKMGTGTLSSGTVTIATTAVTATSLIFLTDTTNSITNLGALTVSSQTAGTGFTVKSSNVLDTSTFNWLIVDGA